MPSLKTLYGRMFLSYKDSKGYSPVTVEVCSDDEKSTLDGEAPSPRWIRPQDLRTKHTASLILSVCLNIFLIVAMAFPWKQPSPSEVTKWAKLRWDTPRPWLKKTPYSSTNLAEASKLWEETLDIDTGMLALTDDFVRSEGLPTMSGRFPWDKDKSIFFVSGFHDLHCLKSVHMSITEWNLGLNQSYELKHITHCLDAVRDAIICQADDTPRFTNFPGDKNLPVQSRMCRSWDKLSKWAAQPHHTACYRYVSEEAKHLDQHERYKYCAKETGLANVVKNWFRKHMNKELPDYYPQITGADEI